MEKSTYKSSENELEKLRTELATEFSNTMEGIENPFLMVLQTHLYLEHLLERYIEAELPEGKTLIAKGNLSFFQKVMVANSIGVIEAQIIDALLKYNSLRNDLAHKFEHSIEKEQVRKIGRTLGKTYSKIEEHANGCLAYEIEMISAHISGCVGFNAHVSEKLERKSS